MCTSKTCSKTGNQFASHTIASLRALAAVTITTSIIAALKTHRSRCKRNIEKGEILKARFRSEDDVQVPK